MGWFHRICGCIAFFAIASVAQSQNFHDFGFARSQNTAVHSQDEQLFLFPWTGGINSVSCAEFDLNGDDFKDLLLFEKHGNRLLTFVNNGIPDSCSYSFQPEFTHLFPRLHDWAIFRDYDGDGRTDIFTYGIAGITVYRNVSDENGLRFELVTEQIESMQFGNLTNLYASPDDYLAIEDVDGDGDLDILNFWLLGKYVHLHKNYSMEEYGDASHLDFRLEDECWGHFEEGGEDNSILLNSSCGRKEEPTRHVGSTLLVKDLTGNGLPDLVLGDIDFPNLVYLQNGGTLQDAFMVSQDTAFPNAEQPIRLFSMPVINFIDINNDGIEELIASPADPIFNKSKDINSVWLYEFNGRTSPYEKATENFMQAEMIDVGSGAAPVLYDWDNDGLTDLFIGNYGSYDTSVYVNGFLTSTFSSSIAYYRNIGTENAPEFQLVTSDFGNLKRYALLGLHPAFGDLDGNGTTDMLCGTADGYVVRFCNNSENPLTPDFGAPDFDFISTDFGDYAKPQLFDLDKDGRIDLIVGNRRGHISFLRNISSENNSVFQLITDTLGGVDVRDNEISYFGYCAPYFFRNNADETVLFCGNEQGQIVYYNQIDNHLSGTFHLEESALQEIGNGWRAAIAEGARTVPAVADLNADGYPDMLVGNYAGGISYFAGTAPPPVSISEYSSMISQFDVRIFPNPSNTTCSIMAESERHCSCIITDITGKMIHTAEAVNGRLQINVSNYPSGIYIVKMTDDDGNVATAKLVIFG